MPPAEREEVMAILDELDERKAVEECREDLIAFCKRIMPTYIVAPHHRRLANLLMDIAAGRKDRITVSVPPRHGKSQLSSILFPAWYLGNNPTKCIIMVSNTSDLATDFGSKVRDIISSPAYQRIFPGTTLSPSKKAAGRWDTSKGGEYFAAGVGTSIAGRGGDIILVDDPHNEQDLLTGNYGAFDKAYTWFTSGLRTRLMSEGKIALIHTRWHLKDLIGRVVADGKNNAKADQYEVFEFPAILPSGKALWPAKFDLESLERTRASMPAYQWAAQYMQQPTSAEAALIKREWWRPWTRGKPPACEYVIMTLDAAAEKHNRADYSALLTFGVFRDDDLTKGEAHLILLNALNVRVEFPELKALCLREYNDWEPDSFIVEKKSAGTQLYQEFRRQGMPVQEFTPTRATGDKVARVNAITDIISSGMVWYPEGRRWAEDVIEQCVAFPVGDHDDMCLVAGTRIAMADGGTKKIEDVLVGDYVQTPLGAKRVLAAGQTGVAPTIRVAVAGKTIEGTGAHRVATQRGWVRLDSVCLSDRIKLAQSARTASCLSSLTQMLFLKLLSLTAGRIGDTQMQPNRRTDDIFLAAADMGCYTGTFGNTTTAPFQPGTMSTTKMRTGVTTTSPIWNYFQNVSTAKNTLSSLQNSIVDPNNWSILRVFVRKLQTGIVAKKVKSGTLKTLLSIFSAAAQPMKRWLKRGKNAGKTHLNYPVFSVVRYLRRLYVELSIAQSRALVERISYENVPQPVYNLTIEDAHCFYANSMLTHNCDCVSLALSRFRQGGFISLPTDHEDKDWQPRRRAAYY